LAKVAVALSAAVERRIAHGSAGCTTARVLAQGDGWSVDDVICTCGPRDRVFEERHAHVSIAIVAGGLFQYRSGRAAELMTPGSLLLGNAGQAFACSHEHGVGDRCVAFHFRHDYFEEAAGGSRGGHGGPFRALRVPPLRELSPIVARACAGLAGSIDVSWEELAIAIAARTLRVVNRRAEADGPPPAAVARVSASVRRIEESPDSDLTLSDLAGTARLSRFHFLRTFEHVTGVTPHQYVLRARLRKAALQLNGDAASVLDVAYDSGFRDVSNFNRAFRAEFGVSPRAYRLS
jgi:AraC family transcriptional regulator